MKKVIFLLFFMYTGSILGQSITASQIKKKTNGGLVGDTANALAVGVYRASTAPSSPIAGQLWLDTSTTPATLKTWNSSAWEISPTGAGTVLASFASLPANPTNGQIVWASSLKRALVYDATDAKWYYLDGTNRPAQADYSLVVSGFPTNFIPSAATSGTATAGGSVTNGTHLCATTFYNSKGGETMIGTPTATLTAGSGNNTLSLTIPTGGAGTVGRRVWCTKAGTTFPFFLIATIQDNSTTTYAVTAADGSFSAYSSPDKDFSASLPAGWACYQPNLTYGGCGSTGSSLLLVAYAQDGVSATASGPRLSYLIPAGSNNWGADFRISRAAGGFSGNAVTSGGYMLIFGLASDPSQQSPEIRALGTFNIGYTYINSASPLRLSRYVHYASNQWGGASGDIAPFAPITGVPIYFKADKKLEGASHVYSLLASADGISYMPCYAVSGGPTACQAYPDFCSTWEPRSVTFLTERSGSESSTGRVIEVDDFTWKIR